MQEGYLVLETDPERPGLIVVGALTSVPQRIDEGCRFAAWFGDLDAALMHLHEALRRSLAQLEPRCYRVGLIDAIAAADAIDLEHRRIFIDPEFAESTQLNAKIDSLRQRHQRLDRWLNTVGLVAAALLAIWGLLPL
ncbi:hypothetical protein [Halochromatium glycolicum]|uniref:Uncharacterized protein n=1 Tax=Halochromatium glycolicum TaxID=85075 RepID=A0AAJ0U5V1_9GAMM|nr:hypothetical protein [Halochromatium glycolicum]MBK1705767.1 hypothetical protein [Halochromatium glycolicum]